MGLLNYDAAVIRDYASKQYDRAACVPFSSGLVGGFVGGGLAVVLVAAADAIPANPNAMLAIMLMGAAVGVVLGGVIGLERAGALRLGAQKALALAQVEQHLELLAASLAVSSMSAAEDSLAARSR